MFDSTTSSSLTKFVNNQDHRLDPFRVKNDDDDDNNNNNDDDQERNWDGETTTLQFRTQHMDDESGPSSPPLWKTSPTRRRTSGLHHHHHHHHHQHPRRTYSDNRVPVQTKFSGRDNHRRSLSPTSRVEAIARGQREMMEMARSMPETYYELSLKDLVEYREETQEECLIQDKNIDDEQEIAVNQAVNVKRQVSGNRQKMARNGSIDNNRGLFLKMVFPVTFRLKKKTKKNSSTTCATGAKVSPKPEGSEKSWRSVDRDWWKRRLSTSSESESVVTSSNSGSSGSSGSSSSGQSTRRHRKKNSMLNSCCSCFQSRKDK